MSLEAAILGFLGEQPRSGYDLKTRCFDDAVGDFWTADQAQIYRTLDRLQTANMVSVARKRQSGRPDRKVYSLTDLGRQALTSWMSTPVPLSAPRDSFLLQLYFGASATDGDVTGQLKNRRALHQARLDNLRDHASHAAMSATVSARQATLRNAAFSGAMAVETAAIDWLDDCIEGVESGGLPPAVTADERQSLLGPSTA
jgi:PadR family transcriptional regulator, regulatory protein AphA